MKQSEIVAGKTYRGRNGKTRRVCNVYTAENYRRPDMKLVLGTWVMYEIHAAIRDVILLRTFARWAIEEVAE